VAEDAANPNWPSEAMLNPITPAIMPVLARLNLATSPLSEERNSISFFLNRGIIF
jgi:hypothetical protein